MFIDEVTIKVNAGNGGDGCLAFKREKFVPMGGPFGGNGGRGADVVFVVDEGLHTLIDLRFMKLIKGDKGENGKGKNQDGSDAKDVIVRVPQGTVVKDHDTGLILADLKGKSDRVTVAHGGRGGRGNTAFKTQSNPAPNFAENGEPGEERTLDLELKMIADVGLVGLPSVGKSTILSRISRATPKIAAYHFTTLSPNLGVVKTKDNRSFVVADLPGLIEGASQGEGLGDKFLRHVERTKVIAHVIDMASTEGRDPYEDYVTINKELENFNSKMLKKPQIIIANKMDVEGAKDHLVNFTKKLDDKNIKIFEVSALNQEGLDTVLIELANMLDNLPNEELYSEESFESHVLYKFKKQEPYTITNEGNGVFRISGDEVEKLFKMTRFSSYEAMARFTNKLRKMGIDEKLESLGIQKGDKVRILDFEFEYE